MKQKLSITVDETVIKEIDESLSSGKYRNRSHVIEYAVKKLLEEKDG